MGCDIFYSGSLADEGLQLEVLRFVTSWHDEIALRLEPIPEERFATSIEHRHPLVDYPFDFIGIIPLFHDKLLEHRQFVFDRTGGGRLVRLLKLPARFNLPSDPVFDEMVPRRWGDVVLKVGGYTREIGAARAYNLLLNIIRLRWWPELRLNDDYSESDYVASDLWEFGLVNVFQNRNLDFNECWRLYQEEYQKRHPKRAEAEEEAVAPLPPVVPPHPELLLIEDLEFSVRTRNILRRFQVGTIGDLTTYSETDLRRMPNMGDKSLKEIAEMLGNLGLHLKPETSQ